ncbi:MAG: T9SS type A sorting domain-containing protein [Flavobacteriales bacterium]|nr:T9SS type A sorting domain-containing protein [Flavobacteriales bacterium]
MLRTTTLLLCCSVARLFAATGGPDAYGYIWKDSNEPDGPVYEWIDIVPNGQIVLGLGDDNIVGPFTMETDHPFYWYGRKNVWIGSNGYIAFNSGNIASPFPGIPLNGGVNDYIAGMMSDLTFAGAGSLARCYFRDEEFRTIISYINVPFWTAAAPGTTGSNTFQIILDKNDSTITVQYQAQTGLTQNTDVHIGIESVAGSIGLQHSALTYPPTNFAIRFYPPVQTTLEVIDAAANWNSVPGNGGLFLRRNGPALPLLTNVANTGNTDLFDVDVSSAVRNANNVVQVSASATVPLVLAALDADVALNAEFAPTNAGTYSFTTTVSGVPDELVADNNSRVQELVVVDTTLAEHDLRFASASDDGVGLSWDGGNGGVAVHLVPPYYPAYASATTVRLVSNAGSSGFSMKVYADDGIDGTAGTLLDSVDVAPGDAVAGDLVIPLSELLTINSGGVYVLWYMNGPNVNIAQDITGPFSLRTYEVLGNTWAEYRDRENVDFHIGLRLVQAPVYDIGCTGFFGIIPGQDIVEPITVRSWITNNGNQPASGFDMNYRFGNGNTVTQPYSGAPVQPGQQVLFSFSQQFDPGLTAVDDLCSWSSWAQDIDATNDTNCVSVNAFVGLQELYTIEAHIRPNPSSTDLSIEGLPVGRYAVTISDAQGRLVARDQHAVSDAPLRVDIRPLADGTYQLQADGGAGIFRSTIVVQH